MLQGTRKRIYASASVLIISLLAGAIAGGFARVLQRSELRLQVVLVFLLLALAAYIASLARSYEDSLVILFSVIPLLGIVAFVREYQEESIIITPTSYFIALAFLAWAGSMAVTKKPLRKAEMALPALFLITSGVASVLHAKDVPLVARSVLNEDLAPFVFYVIVLNSIGSFRMLNLTLIGFLASSGSTVVASLLRVLWGGYVLTSVHGLGPVLETMRYWTRKYIGGLFLNANIYGGFLLLVIPVALCLALWGPFQNRWTRAFCLVVSFGSALVALLTFSRSVWLVCLAFVLVLLILKRRVLAALAVPLLLSLLLVLFSDSPLFWRLAQTGTSSDAVRYELLGAGVETFLDHPFTGVGARNFERIIDDGTFFSTHNALLDAAAERGLIGVFAFVFFAYRSLRLAVSAYASQRLRNYHGLILGAAAAIFSLILYSLTSGAGFFMYRNNTTSVVVFWGLLAILESVHTPQRSLLATCRPDDDPAPATNESGASGASQTSGAPFR